MKHVFVAVLAAFFLFFATLSATVAGLKAGDVDPKNGKVIKY